MYDIINNKNYSTKPRMSKYMFKTIRNININYLANN